MKTRAAVQHLAWIVSKALDACEQVEQEDTGFSFTHDVVKCTLCGGSNQGLLPAVPHTTDCPISLVGDLIATLEVPDED